jgi:hypothetical protein
LQSAHGALAAEADELRRKNVSTSRDLAALREDLLKATEEKDEAAANAAATAAVAGRGLSAIPHAESTEETPSSGDASDGLVLGLRDEAEGVLRTSTPPTFPRSIESARLYEHSS